MMQHLLLAIFLIAGSGRWLCAQTPVPQRLELPHYDTLPPSQLISGAFYPLGFSENGKFAYAIAPADEACGCYFFEFRIQDLITDKVLYRYAYRSDQGPQSGQYEKLEDLWAGQSAMLIKKMKAYGLVLAQPVFSSLQDDLEVLFTLKKFSEPGLSDTKFIRSAKVEVRTPRMGQKRVAHLQFDNLYVQNVATLGSFKSPYEDRVALLVARTDRGWEGLPQVLDFEVIGVHRTKGYR